MIGRIGSTSETGQFQTVAFDSGETFHDIPRDALQEIPAASVFVPEGVPDGPVLVFASEGGIRADQYNGKKCRIVRGVIDDEWRRPMVEFGNTERIRAWPGELSRA